MTRLADLTWTAAAAAVAEERVLLVPLGATEQHGPHLPLTTDTDIAVAVAERAARRLPALVAPALAFGSSGEHEAFPGTLSIGSPAAQLVLVELARSATRHVPAVVFVSTHGGNRDALGAATALLRSEGRTVLGWSPGWSGDLHAGRTETSLMLAISPERVRMETAEAGDRRPASVLIPIIRRDGVRAVSENGVLGDPTGASAAEGRQLLEAAAAHLAELAAGARVEAGAGAAGVGR